jgi:hypothetical protein
VEDRVGEEVAGFRIAESEKDLTLRDKVGVMDASFSKSKFYIVILLIASVIGYPPSFVISYILAIKTPGLTVDSGVNSFSIVLIFFIPLLFIFLALRYWLWLCLRGWVKGDIAKDSWRMFLKAHRSCLYIFPFTVLISCIEMEGNAFGILILPILLIMSLIIGWKVQKILWGKSLS